MTCGTVTPYLVDLARGVSLDADRRVEIDSHLRECRRCAARLEDERAVSAALGRLARATGEPAPDPEVERALLAAFDEAWARPRVVARWRTWQPLAAAAIVVLAASVVLTMAIRRAGIQPREAAPPPASVVRATPAPVATVATVEPVDPVKTAKTVAALNAASPRHVPAHRARAEARDTSAFVPWPGAETLPTFESGRLMRLDLPASVAISLGLTPRASSSGIVRADLLIGQDGLARAVRVAP